MRLSCRIMFLSLIFIIEILTWTDGAAIGARRAIPQYTQDYVYEVPGQGAAFYGNTLAGSPVVVDSGDDFRYRQEELVFSPGSEDELRVRPDGTAVYTEVMVDDVKPPSHTSHQKRSSGAEEEQQVQQNPSDTNAGADKPSTTSTEAPVASSTSTSTTPKSDEEPKKSPEKEQSKEDSKQNKTEDNKKDKRGPTQSFDLPPMDSELGDQELVDAFSNIEEKRKNRSPTATTSEMSSATNVGVSVEQPENPQFSTTTKASTVTTMKSSEKKKRENGTPPPTPVVTTEAATMETTEPPKIPAVVATESSTTAPALSSLSMLKVDIPHQAVLVTEVESLESEEETTKKPERKREVQPETVFTTTTEPPMTSTVQEMVTTTTTTTVSTTTTTETEAPTVTPKVAVRSVTATEATVAQEVFKKDTLVLSLVMMKMDDNEEKLLPGKRTAAQNPEETTKVLQLTADPTTTQASVEETSKQPAAPSLSVLVVPVITQEKQEEKVSHETKLSPQDEKGEMQNAKRSVQPETSTAKLQIEIDLQEESDERAPGSGTIASDKEKDAIIQINTRASNVAPAESKMTVDNAKEVFKAAVQTTKEIIDPASPISEEREENARASSQAEVKGGEGFKRNIPVTELVSKSIVVPLEEKVQSPAVSIAKQTADSNKPQNEDAVANTMSKQETSEIGTELAPVVIIKRGIDSDEDDESEENALASSPIHVEDNAQQNAPASQLETLPGRVVVVAKQVVKEEVTDTTTIAPATSVDIDGQEKKASSVNTVENGENDGSAPTKMLAAKQVTESEEEEEESEEKPGEAGAKVTNKSLKEVAPGNSVNQSVSAAASKVETDEEEDSDETEQETPASSIATATSATTAIDKKQNNEDEENAPASNIDSTSKGPGKLADSAESETDSKQTESEEEENEGSAPGTNVGVSTTTSTSVDTPAKQTEKDEDEEGSDSEESEETKHVNKREGDKELVPVITIVEGGTTKDGGSSAKDVKKEREAESGEDADTSKEKGQQDSEEEAETGAEKREKSEESEESKGDGDEAADDDDDDKRNPPGAAFRLTHGRHSTSHGHGHGRRRRREAAMPRDYYQVYHRRYKRSPDISNIREVIVDGKKVYLDVPEAVPVDNPHPRSSPTIMQNNDDPEAVRKTRQTVNELLSISTPKVARFPPAFCELERDSGILCPGVRRGIFLEQFYYDSGSNRCSHFVYNGCGGNANRFSTLWECTQFCGKKLQSEHSKMT